MDEIEIKKLSKIMNYELDIKSISREIFINKFIEKLPKAKLHTLIQINKYYNNKNNDTNMNNLDNIFSLI